jgi:diacylglycerol kinase family enzyme
VDSGAGLVIACGGDGTINEVACGMAHSRVPLAILPGGTANVLARELGLPLDIPAAARQILGHGTARRLSLGRAGTRYFMLMAGIGFDAAIVRRVRVPSKKLLGMGTYILEAFRQLIAVMPPDFTLRTDQRRLTVTFACISKSRHYGPIEMVREADLFSDHFYVYGFRSRNRIRYLLYALAVVSGTVAGLRDVDRFPAREVYCEPNGTNGPTFIQVDGELLGQLPCKIEIVPDALTLIVPESRGAAGAAPSSKMRSRIAGISSTARIWTAAAFA